MESVETPSGQLPKAELVVLTGRLEGARRPLQIPLTLVGSAPCCDIRLTATGVHALHCLISHGSAGYLVRDLQTENGTYVNRERITERQLRDGDVLAIGQVQVRLEVSAGYQAAAPARPAGPKETATRTPSMELEIEAHRSALRVQVAAVAAQQAAVLEEEARLHQQQTALAQQQEQLSAHLEEKRQRILELADQVQAARAAVNRDREDHTRLSAQQATDAARSSVELEANHKKVETERQRIKHLRRRLKQHVDRQLAVERKQIRNREIAVSDQQQRLEKEAAKLQQERDALVRARMSFNGDAELGKRQLQAKWDEHKQQEKQLKEEHKQSLADLAAQRQEVEQRAATVAETERQLAKDKREWELQQKVAVKETEGLEKRIIHLRQKLSDQQNELEQVRSRVRSAQEDTPQAAQPDGPAIQPIKLHVVGGVEGDGAGADRAGEDCALQDKAADLQRWAEDLDDHRLTLIEYWQRLAQTQLEWEQAREAAADKLEALAQEFPAKEKNLRARQAAIAAAEADLRQRQQEMWQFRQHLEGWASRIRARESTWEGERDRLWTDVEGREQAADKHLEAIVALRQSWLKQRQQELDMLAAERASCESLRQEGGTLRQESLKRALSLEQQQRELAEKTLALEEYRQRFVLQSQDAAAVESRLERIRLRWMQQNRATISATQDQFTRLETEAARLEQRGRDLFKAAADLTKREAELAQRQSEWEENATLSQVQQTNLEQQLESAQAQRERYERQISELQAEIEHLALVLMGSAEEPPATLMLKAA